MKRFFVYHPVFAWVVAIFVALFGIIGLRLLPVEQYPQVAPPALNLQITYNGADAATLDRTVTSIIEKEMNGVENFLYMSSTSRSNGTAQVTVTFKPGTDLDVARTQVQDRLSRVEPRLPTEVRQLGISVTKSSSGFLMLVAFQAEDGAMSALDMGNFASSKIMDELRRVPGVGDVQLFGSPYAMRVWLDEEKLAGYGISAADALAAVQEQNSQTAGGGLGEQPLAGGAEINAKIITQNRFSTPEQFRQIIVRSNPDGSTIRLGDVARVELGKDNYGFRLTLNGRETAGMAIQLASGANALGTAEAIKARLTELEKIFPPGLSWTVPYDTTPFITASVDSVIHTLVEAMVLVFLVMFLFLQNWRATLIPALVVPVALAGSCLGLYLFGYWNNHHHLMQATGRIDGRVLWANLFLLFWLSLVPFVIRWLDASGFSPMATASYGVVLGMAAIGYELTERFIIACNGRQSAVAKAIGRDWKGKISLAIYAVAVPAAFFARPVAIILYIVVLLFWLAPDRRIERALKD